MDAIWSTRRYVPVTVDFDILTHGKKILKAASSKSKKQKQQQQQQHQQQHQQQQQQEQQLLPDQHEAVESTTIPMCLDVEPLHIDEKEKIKVEKTARGVSWGRQRPLDLSFSDVGVVVDKTPILANVSGTCRPGELMAVMGPSGSGKTTLLNVLSGRQKPTGGSIHVGGQILTKRLRRKICYVLQQDIFFPELTLRQTIMYTAFLRLPDTMSRKAKVAHVDHIINILDLTRCQHTVIGRGLSGGERKRANIACELLTNPAIMLLDEPTSGLDSSTAATLVRTLRRYAHAERKAVVVTLHQPSSQIFYMFDSLLLLCNGQTAYSGETRGVVHYFASVGMPMTAHYNPADFILEKTKGSVEDQSRLIQAMRLFQHSSTLHSSTLHNSTNSLGSKYLDVITSSGSCGQCEWDVDCAVCQANLQAEQQQRCDDSRTQNTEQKPTRGFSKTGGEDEDSGRSSWSEDTESHLSSITTADEDVADTRWPTSFCTQLRVLTERNFMVAKHTMWSRLNWVQTVSLSVMAGLLWFQAPRIEERLQDIQGWMFFSTTYWMLFHLFGALTTFPSEREVIQKERASGSYRTSAYYTAKMIGELPLTITMPTIYFVISYPMMGCHSAMTAVLLLLMLLLNTIVAQSVGLLVGAACMDLQVGISVAAIFTLFTQLFGGFLATRIPPWLTWAKYLSMVHFAFQNMNIIEFEQGPRVRCATENSRFQSCTRGDKAEYVEVEDILGERGQTFSFWVNVCILLVYMVAARILAYMVLRFLRRPK